MEENKTNTTEQKSKRTPYEKGWWFFFYTFIVSLFTPLITTSNSIILAALFFAALILSAILGIYSLIFFSKLPKGMAISGIFQGCIFGFCVLGKLAFTWLSK